MKIVVVGLGYVGLSIAILLSQYNSVIGTDIDKKKINKLNDKISPIEDQDIQEYLASHTLDIKWKINAIEDYKDASFIVISTPTNYDPDTNKFDTSSIESVVNDIVMSGSNATIVIKSTIPIGYTKSLVESYKGVNFIFCPEFLREGKALSDNLFPSRIVIGYDKESGQHEAEAFATLLKSAAIKDNIPVIYSGYSEAEAIKLFSNAYLAVRVSYFNELDSFCIANNLDTKSIIDGVSADPRIGDHYNNPSIGYGGYCLPKDTKQLKANFANIPQSLMGAVIESNSLRKEYVASSILEKWEKSNKKPVGIYKLAMKMGSDNSRESAMHYVVSYLHDHNVPVIIYEPSIKEFPEEKDDKISFTKSLKSLVKKTSFIVANRVTQELKDEMYIEKFDLYTRDIFNRD